MSTAVSVAVPLLVGAALVVAALILVVARDGRTALAVLLDLLLAAGLLRLTEDGSWRVLATAALVVVVRKVATAGIGTRRSARQE